MAKRQKIAVIGGGMSALTAVYEITKTPGWRKRYDIDIYQLGWRIGGKGASGRNPHVGQRIEEHGLHIWFGFYTNAFNFIKDCYANLGETSSPIKTFDDAFKPQSFIPVCEQVNGKWDTWNLYFPTNEYEVGGEDNYLPLWEYIRRAIFELRHVLKNTIEGKAYAQSHVPESKNFSDISDKIGGMIGDTILNQGMDMLDKILETLEEASQNAKTENTEKVLDQLNELNRWLKNIVADFIKPFAPARRLFVLTDITLTIIRGILCDNLIHKGLDVVNDEEFRDWLERHGASDITLSSGVITALYDVGFAYENGDIEKPNYEAGSAIRIILRLIFGYKGAFMWKMQAGMGDIIFTPIYEILSRYKSSPRQGGINFKFFHRIKNLGLSEDKNSIENILVEEQATLKNPDKPYNPLVDVKGVPCWPSEPDYDQLVEGEELKAKNINLESFWSPWKGKEKTLKQGKDYDLVLLGTPVASLPHICPELLGANPKWLDMVENVKTTQTQAYQIWLNKSLKEMGWEHPSPIMTSFVEPVDTWADMSHLIHCEEFPEEHEPKNIAYFCGVLKDASTIPPFSIHNFPETQHQRAKESLKKFLKEDAKIIWKNIASDKGFNYHSLIDVENRSGEDRVNGQYWRANIDPHERYTLTNVNSSKYRLKTDETGFDNLYITGDWIQNSFNYGCIEACVMSGMMTARAITSFPISIVGEDAWG